MYHLLNPSQWCASGSVLGPLLFLIYVNDLHNHVQSPAGIKIFADDTKLYLGYTENQNTPLMQSLNQFCSWSKTWQLTVTYSKCSVISFGSHGYEPTSCTLLTFWYSFAIRIIYKRYWGVFEFKFYAKYALLKYCRHAWLSIGVVFS